MMDSEKNKRLCFYLSNILIPLFIGLLIYIIFRPDAYVTLLIRKTTGIQFPSIKGSSIIINIIRGFASDVLWAYALEFAVYAVMQKSKNDILKSGIISISFIVFVELLQKFKVINGTFDILDIILEIIAIIIGSFIIKKKTKE